MTNSPVAPEQLRDGQDDGVDRAAVLEEVTVAPKRAGHDPVSQLMVPLFMMNVPVEPGSRPSWIGPYSPATVSFVVVIGATVHRVGA